MSVRVTLSSGKRKLSTHSQSVLRFDIFHPFHLALGTRWKKNGDLRLSKYMQLFLFRYINSTNRHIVLSAPLNAREFGIHFLSDTITSDPDTIKFFQLHSVHTNQQCSYRHSPKIITGKLGVSSKEDAFVTNFDGHSDFELPLVCSHAPK